MDLADLKDELNDIFYNEDPIGICWAEEDERRAPKDEYENEVNELLLDLTAVKDIETLKGRLLEVFQIWFGNNISGTTDTYDTLANKIWPILIRENLVRT